MRPLLRPSVLAGAQPHGPRPLRRCLARAESTLSAPVAPSPLRDQTAIFFPGQGVQKPGMLAPLLRDFPGTVGPLVEQLDATLPPADGAPPLSRILAAGPPDVLTATENAQPLVLLTSMAIARVLAAHFDFVPAAHATHFLGHSLGEFTAAAAAGFVALDDVLRLVRRRGAIMAECAARASVPELDGGPGEVGMVALVVERGRVPSLIAGVDDFLHSETLPNDEFLSVANINSATQIVLSGHLKSVAACLRYLQRFSGHDPRAIRLNVSAPFHSPIMAPAVRGVRDMLAEMDVHVPPTEAARLQGGGTVRLVGNATAEPVPEDAAVLREMLATQATATVRWAQSVAGLEAAGVGRWIGIGPGKVGGNLVAREVKGGLKRVVMVEGTGGKEMEEAVRKIEKLEV